MVIFKCRDTGNTDWRVYHKTISPTNAISLNGNGNKYGASSVFSSAFTSTLLKLENDSGGVNRSGSPMIAYCFAPKQGFTYYKIHEYGNLVKKFNDEKIPVGLEQIVETIGYPKPVDQHGNWLKNPINPDAATPDDYVELDKNTQVTTQNVTKTQDKELDDWLNS